MNIRPLAYKQNCWGTYLWDGGSMSLYTQQGETGMSLPPACTVRMALAWCTLAALTYIYIIRYMLLQQRWQNSSANIAASDKIFYNIVKNVLQKIFIKQKKKFFFYTKYVNRKKKWKCYQLLQTRNCHRQHKISSLRSRTQTKRGEQCSFCFFSLTHIHTRVI